MAKFTFSLNGPSLKISDQLKKSSFDYTSRHQLIAELIVQYFGGKAPKKILDVGGLGSPLSKILGSPTTILDEEATDTGNEAQGDGARMKFADNSFDVVITSDTLEHIPEKDRENFIAELCRVSSDLVILCAPFDHDGSAKEEQKLQDYFKGLTGEEHRWLREHKEYVLPKTAKIDKYFAANKVNFISFNHTSLKIWRTIMALNLASNEMGQQGVFKKTQQLNKFYNEKVMYGDFGADGYRTFYIASKKNQLAFKQPQGIDADTALELSGKISDVYETALTEAEYVPLLRTKIKNMHDEKIQLAALVEEERQAKKKILESRSWKTIQKINGVRQIKDNKK